MTALSEPLSTQQWIFPTITNSYEIRLAGRKRTRDTDEGESQGSTEMYSKGSNKKPKIEDIIKSESNAFNTSNTHIDSQAPHQFLASDDDWKYGAITEDDIPLDQDIDAPTESVDVEKVIAVLLDVLNASKQKSETPEPPVSLHQRQPTSPLSESPSRTPLVRKSVGGACRGRFDPGLQKWVLCKNHLDDVRSYHPSHRSSDWIEALHEMGWEHLHPTYMSQSQQTFTGVELDPTPFNEWIAEDHPSAQGAGIGGLGDEEDWDLVISTEVPSQRAQPSLVL